MTEVKKIDGVGIREEGFDKATEDGRHTKLYTLWKNMLARCYSKTMNEHRPTYIGCSVEGDFIYFQKFAAWYDSQSTDKTVDYQLDKDLISKGNKVYSENTCLLVPRKINMFLCKSEAARGKYRIGVHYQKHYGMFCAQVSNSGFKIVEYFNTEDKAFAFYKQEKEKIAKGLADKFRHACDPRVIEALENYEVHEDD